MHSSQSYSLIPENDNANTIVQSALNESCHDDMTAALPHLNENRRPLHLDELCSAMKAALELKYGARYGSMNCFCWPFLLRWLCRVWKRPSNRSQHGISESFCNGLLEEPAAILEGERIADGCFHVETEKPPSSSEQKKKDENDAIAEGLPCRPLYRELCQRLILLSEYQHCQQRCEIQSHAGGFEMSESTTATDADFTCLQNTPLPLDAEECVDWLDRVGEDGIRHLLGLRSTVGTLPHLLPPDRHVLLTASQKPHKPHAKGPLLSVAARARAKHAHRCTSDGQSFFLLGDDTRSKNGNRNSGVTGSAKSQNEHANRVVHKMLTEATWINIHQFGGVNQPPVLEVRVASGYGARWTAAWSTGGESSHPSNVVFRGFLEPQMPDGHLKGWRH